jgi:hypothetical protein
MAKKTAEEIMREADALVEQALRSLSGTEHVYAANGLDPQKLGSTLAPKEQADALAEGQALFRKDMEDVEREVGEEAARLSFANAAPRAGGARKMRNMV